MPRIVVMGAGLGGMSAAYELREVLGKIEQVAPTVSTVPVRRSTRRMRIR